MSDERTWRVFALTVILFCGSSSAATPIGFASLGPAESSPGPKLDREALVERIRAGRSIFLRAGAFDPLVEASPSLDVPPLPLAPSLEAGVWLVQFDRDLDRWERGALERLGARFLDFIPSHAYLVRATGKELAPLLRSDAFRWVGEFRPEYKVEPRLLEVTTIEPLRLDVRLLPDEDAVLFLSRLEAKHPSVRFESIWGDRSRGARVRVVVPEDGFRRALFAIANDPAVWSVDPWFLPWPANDQTKWVIQDYDTVNRTAYGLSMTIWNHGIIGTGQVVAVSDTGLDSDMCYFKLAPGGVTDAQTPVLPSPGTLDPTKKVIGYAVVPGASSYDRAVTACTYGAQYGWAYGFAFHGTAVAGVIAGDNFANLSSPGGGGHDAGDGMAPNAKIFVQDIGQDSGPEAGCLMGALNAPDLLFEQVYASGARIQNSSWVIWSYGDYVYAAYADALTWEKEDFLVVYAAGNSGLSGPGNVWDPATAKNCLAVGALSPGTAAPPSDAVWANSSRGPTQDGRIKPDVCAPGQSIVTALGDALHTSNNCATGAATSSTSMAAGAVSGGLALVRQYLTDGFYPTGAKVALNGWLPSAALLKAILVNGADDVGAGDAPNSTEGWGRIHLDQSLFFSTPSRDARTLRIWDRRNSTGLVTNDLEEQTISVAAGQPLEVTLVWTDPEPSGVAGLKLVNDLDLEVVSPGGSVYKGNVFSGGASMTGGSADLQNNVEGVRIAAPVPGIWTVRVRARAIPGRPGLDGSDRQGYALVATFADCLPGVSVAPVVTAVDGGLGGINVSWSPVAGANRYQVYRADGSCASPGDFSYVGSTTGNSFTDALVVGGFEYAYFVRGVDDCGEGPRSNCSSTFSTGDCAIPPSFAGLGSATNDLTTTACDILLAWPAAATGCPGSPVAYNVYRGTTPSFVPNDSNRIASGISSSSWRDATVVPKKAYFYVVRAEDQTTGHGGLGNGGNEDSNLVVRGATATSASSTSGTWSDDGGDTVTYLSLDPPWRVSSTSNHTPAGSFGYRSSEEGSAYPPSVCAAAMTPPIALQAGSPVLSYWARYNVEYQWDLVVVEISSNGGANWTISTPTVGYPGALANPGNACLYPVAQQGFTGPIGNATQTAWAQFSHNLGAWAGQTVLVRWRLAGDNAYEYSGFFLDDIAVSLASVPNDCSVSNGFVRLDRSSYRCASGSIVVTVTDFDLKGAGAVTVNLSSGVEPGGEVLSLTETGSNSGIFSGSISSTSAAPTADGLLSLSDGTSITATYVDADDGLGGVNVPKEATAEADCVPPVISDVAISGVSYDRATVSWSTNENANSRVTYDTAPPPATNVDDLSSFVLSHQSTLTGLLGCTGHVVSVSSTDAAGNTATDTNGGTYYAFETTGKGLAFGPDNVENGTNGWTVTQLAGSTNWHIDSCKSNSPTRAWKAGAVACPGTIAAGSGTRLVSPALDLGPIGHGYWLRFRQWVGVDPTSWCYVEASVNGGAWDYLDYFNGFSNGWISAAYDLSAFAGSNVRVAFELYAGSSTVEGWYIDDIEIARSAACAPSLARQSHTVTTSCSLGGTGLGVALVEPGEESVISITTRNSGTMTATGVRGTLSTTTPGVTIGDAVAFFPEVPAGTNRTSLAPHFQFSVAPGAACGGTIAFSITFDSDSGSWIDSFTVPIGLPASGGTYSFFSGAVGIPVPNLTTVTSTIDVIQPGSITDANVSIDVSHEADQDLDIFLISPPPASLRVELASDNGGTGNDYTGTQFDDEAATSITAGTPPYSGIFRPEGSLATIDGVSAPGTWTLEVTDDSGGGNTGVLNSWSMQFALVIPPQCASCAAFAPLPVRDGTFVPGTPMTAVRSADAVDVSWSVAGCLSADYDIYWGGMASFAGFTGGDCSVGTSGTALGVAIPGDSWFVVAGAEGNRVSSFGKNSAGDEEPFSGWSGVCTARTAQSLAGSCP